MKHKIYCCRLTFCEMLCPACNKAELRKFDRSFRLCLLHRYQFDVISMSCSHWALANGLFVYRISNCAISLDASNFHGIQSSYLSQNSLRITSAFVDGKISCFTRKLTGTITKVRVEGEYLTNSYVVYNKYAKLRPTVLQSIF